MYNVSLDLQTKEYYFQFNSGLFLVSKVMEGHEIESKAGVCKNGERVEIPSFCTVAYTPKPCFQSYLPW